ncbi:DUF2399 domain-containing protein [Rossellomorea vietnamensis]|uniref:toprim domain-containing protein n=1 Tax=Rossellomorea vietnamensis TaxID=218284 RepID=UPI001CCFA892|nr:DUF2399 domain-containing protein [Rossellomorea vietnamensis]MCA0149715.1 DUF2399 domain-containing protein [Rossellomorea vietnamensis]
MVKDSLLSYLKKYILRSGEQLEWSEADREDRMIDMKISKRTERTYRVLGMISVSTEVFETDITLDHQLDLHAFTPRKKVKLDEGNRQTYKWLEQGWIIKEVRFEKDERTVKSSCYRMGYNLYQFEQSKQERANEKVIGEISQIKMKIEKLASSIQEGCEDKSTSRKVGIRNLIKHVLEVDSNDVRRSPSFSEEWKISKRLKFLHFATAVCQLSLLRQEFDWKEIGAVYYQEIGGSKEFDRVKQAFIDQLEEWVSVPVQELGLTSLGQVTPVFFSGQLSGRYSHFSFGPVHALTSLSIANEKYKTDATVLWLVENRAIVTRMAAADGFLEQNNALIICVDGHVRSAHKNAIVQLLNNSEVKQVIIWCDYDLDGVQIANELFSVVSPFTRMTYKWILPNKQVTCDKSVFDKEVRDFLFTNTMEQEEMMGGVALWTKWIQA